MISAEKIAQIKDFLLEKIDPDFIVLFGSQATGNTHSQSDVDLAFHKKNHQLSSYDTFMLAGELASMIGVDVDLIDLNTASTVFRAQIFGKGKLLYAKSDYEFNVYEMKVFRMYAELNEQRQEVLREIHESGSVYGTRLGRRKK